MPASHQSTLLLVLRRLRAPLITLIVIMAVAVLGLTIAPGPLVDGRPSHMSFFHALYFVSYTATTIGFGEIPEAFSEQQRLWVLACIYMSVVGWAYTLGTVFALLQDNTFRQAIAFSRFTRGIARLREPFLLVCGYGETGRLICQALERLGYRAAVIEIDAQRAGESELHSYHSDLPTLSADAALPETLIAAGLKHPSCRAVLALTNSDSANLAIAISARLLAPGLPALCRAESPEAADNMASFGTPHILNPFHKFSEYLALALRAPDAYHLLLWLTGLPGATVARHRPPPRGHWILCGYGRFGRLVVDTLEDAGLPVTVIDHEPPADASHRWVKGDATGAAALLEAGVKEAVGIVAATAQDVDNLSIAVTARELNPELFTVVRQNLYANRALYTALGADITVIPSEIIAHECLAILSTPLLKPFLKILKGARAEWGQQLLAELTASFGWETPTVWSLRLDAKTTPALHIRLAQGEPLTIADLLRQPDDRACALPARVLYLQRDAGRELLLPTDETPLACEDELLLVGGDTARKDLELICANQHTLSYVLTGKELPGGWIWEKLAGMREAAAARKEPGQG